MSQRVDRLQYWSDAVFMGPPLIVKIIHLVVAIFVDLICRPTTVVCHQITT